MLFFSFAGAVALKAPSNTFTHGADDLKKMMESVRVQTEGDLDTDDVPHHKTVLAAQKQTQLSASQAELLLKTQVSAGEAELLHRTDAIEKRITQEKHPVAPPAPTPKPLSLKQGAARYFSINGMKDMSEMLDDQLSDDEEETLVKQDKIAQDRVAHVRSAEGHQAELPPTADSKSLEDTDFDDNDEYKSNWKRVEALKSKMPPM